MCRLPCLVESDAGATDYSVARAKASDSKLGEAASKTDRRAQTHLRRITFQTPERMVNCLSTAPISEDLAEYMPVSARMDLRRLNGSLSTARAKVH